MATLIMMDGATREVNPTDNSRFQKQEIKNLLGGDFYDVEELTGGILVLVPQGRGLKMNIEATKSLKTAPLFGNVLLVSHDEYDPDEE